MAKDKEKYPHFRYYKKSKHPALITGEHSKEEYKYRKVMHSEKDGKRNNEKRPRKYRKRYVKRGGRTKKSRKTIRKSTPFSTYHLRYGNDARNRLL